MKMQKHFAQQQKMLHNQPDIKPLTFSLSHTHTQACTQTHTPLWSSFTHAHNKPYYQSSKNGLVQTTISGTDLNIYIQQKRVLGLRSCCNPVTQIHPQVKTGCRNFSLPCLHLSRFVSTHLADVSVAASHLLLSSSCAQHALRLLCTFN